MFQMTKKRRLFCSVLKEKNYKKRLHISISLKEVPMKFDSDFSYFVFYLFVRMVQYTPKTDWPSNEFPLYCVLCLLKSKFALLRFVVLYYNQNPPYIAFCGLRL